MLIGYAAYDRDPSDNRRMIDCSSYAIKTLKGKRKAPFLVRTRAAKTVTTRRVFRAQNIRKMRFWLGSTSDPAGELTALPQTSSWFCGREREEKGKGKGMGGKRSGKGKMGKGRERGSREGEK